MKPEITTLIRYRITLAKETLDDAKTALERKHLHGSVNRLYYACFYVVSALLLTQGLRSPKHTGVLSLFNQHWVKTGRLSAEAGRFYGRMFENRLEADYGDLVVLTREQVETWLCEAKTFVDQVTALVDERVREQT